MKKKKEQTFGEVIGPALSQIEDAILDRQNDFPSVAPGYTKDAFRAAIAIFMDVSVDFLYEHTKRLGLSKMNTIQFAEMFGEEFRSLIFRYCDIATEKL